MHLVRLSLTRRGVSAPESRIVDASDDYEALGSAIRSVEGRDWLLPPGGFEVLSGFCLPFISLAAFESMAVWRAATNDLGGHQVRLCRAFCLLIVSPEGGESVAWQW